MSKEEELILKRRPRREQIEREEDMEMMKDLEEAQMLRERAERGRSGGRASVERPPGATMTGSSQFLKSQFQQPEAEVQQENNQ